jgi:putative MFS transporter
MMLELLEGQQRLTANQWKLISAAILGIALGSLAFFLANFTLGFASQHLTYAQSPLIQLSVGGSSVLGPAVWGWMAAIRAWVPESPRWLIRNGLLEEAKRSLVWALRKNPNEIDLPAASPKMPHTPWRELFNYPRSVVVTCLTSLVQVGGVGIGLWAGVYTSILHITWSTVVYLTLGVGLAGLVGQFVMSYLSDAMGRRKSGMICGFGAALSLALAGYYYNAFFGTASVFWLLVMFASFFGVGSAAIVRPYTAEVWPVGLRASGMGLAYGVGNLGGLIAPRGIELIIGAPSYSSPQATPESILPALLFLAAWYALAGLVF